MSLNYTATSSIQASMQIIEGSIELAITEEYAATIQDDERVVVFDENVTAIFEETMDVQMNKQEINLIPVTENTIVSD